jgi:hypothetical protein
LVALQEDGGEFLGQVLGEVGQEVHGVVIAARVCSVSPCRCSVHEPRHLERSTVS